MQEVRNSRNKLICRVDAGNKAVEIVLKGCKTVIRFIDDGAVKIIHADKPP